MQEGRCRKQHRDISRLDLQLLPGEDKTENRLAPLAGPAGQVMKHGGQFCNKFAGYAFFLLSFMVFLNLFKRFSLTTCDKFRGRLLMIFPQGPFFIFPWSSLRG